MNLICTSHALERMAERGIAPEVVEGVVMGPHIVLDGNGCTEGCDMLQSGGIRVIVARRDSGKPIVLTAYRAEEAE